jgi:hypothetical protein
MVEVLPAPAGKATTDAWRRTFGHTAPLAWPGLAWRSGEAGPITAASASSPCRFSLIPARQSSNCDKLP